MYACSVNLWFGGGQKENRKLWESARETNQYNYDLCENNKLGGVLINIQCIVLPDWLAQFIPKTNTSTILRDCSW